jgi:NAD+ kinase
MPVIKTVGIISKPKVRQAGEIVSGLVAWLQERGIEVRCDDVTASYTTECSGVPRDEVPEGADLVIVLGGDGTLLSAARP